MINLSYLPILEILLACTSLQLGMDAMAFFERGIYLAACVNAVDCVLMAVYILARLQPQ